MAEGVGVCECDEGFVNDGGCVAIDACIEAPCGSSATCTDLPAPAGGGEAGRSCVCNDGLVGDPEVNCASSDGDACVAYPCGANAACADLPAPAPLDASGRTCACAPGYGGDATVGCVDVDACVGNPCGANATCTDLAAPAGGDAAGRTCECAAGFGGTSCTDIDECDASTDPCGVDGTATTCRAPMGASATTARWQARTSPVAITTGWSELDTSWRSTCGVRVGRVACWGRNDGGQLGNGSTLFNPTPNAIAGVTGFTQLMSGSDFM